MEIKIKELKDKIETKSISDSFLVLVYPDNTFLANQYVNEIAKIKNKEKIYIETLEQVKFNKLDMFNLSNDYLYIINTEKFESNIIDFYKYKNVVVICNQISEKTKPAVVSTGTHTVLPKLQEWQILEYMKKQVPGIPENQLKEFYDTLQGDMYRIHNELLKFSLFDNKQQLELFKQVNSESGYNDLSSIDLYTFTNALLKKDMKILYSALLSIKATNVEPMGLVIFLHKNIRNIINVKFDTKSTPELLKMTDKQFNYISYNYKNFSIENLSGMFEFITSIDFNLKSGLLQMAEDRLIDYIVVNILQLMNTQKIS